MKKVKILFMGTVGLLVLLESCRPIADPLISPGPTPEASLRVAAVPSGGLSVWVPSFVVAGQPASFSGTVTNADITKVSATLDGFAVAQDIPVVGGSYTFSVTLNTPGLARRMQVVGNSASNTALGSAGATVEVKAAGSVPGPVLISGLSSVKIGQTIQLAGTTGSGIATISATIDGYTIGAATNLQPVNGQFTFGLTLLNAGIARKLVVIARSASGVKVGETLKYIDAVAAVVANVPYFWQMNNQAGPGSGTCAVTSFAMVLRYFTGGTDVTPDNMIRKWGGDYRVFQAVSGIENYFNREAVSRNSPWRDQASYTATPAQLRAQLDKGIPAIVHGYFTNSGHVMVVLGYDADYYYCNDPYGKWGEVYKGSSSYIIRATGGIGVRYRRAPFERAIGSGGDAWIHFFSKN